MEYCSSGSLLNVLEDPANAFGLAESEFLIVLQCVGEWGGVPAPPARDGRLSAIASAAWGRGAAGWGPWGHQPWAMDARAGLSGQKLQPRGGGFVSSCSLGVFPCRPALGSGCGMREHEGGGLPSTRSPSPFPQSRWSPFKSNQPWGSSPLRPFSSSYV